MKEGFEAMEDWMMDKLHAEGTMPDWAYYQQRKSNRPLVSILWEQTDPMLKEYEERRLNNRQQQKQEEEVQIQIEQMIGEVFENFLNGDY